MKPLFSVRRLTLAAMFAALTFLATSVLRIPTPSLGYIHTGDAFVLLSGFILGPLDGALAAGTGSMLADLLGGYPVWAPGTFIIKFLTACTASLIWRICSGEYGKVSRPALRILAAGVIAEAVMTAGYFLYEILLVLFAGGGFTRAGFLSAAAAAAAGLPFNAVQGFTGILLSMLMLPVFHRISIRLVSPAGS